MSRVYCAMTSNERDECSLHQHQSAEGEHAVNGARRVPQHDVICKQGSGNACDSLPFPKQYPGMAVNPTRVNLQGY